MPALSLPKGGNLKMHCPDEWRGGNTVVGTRDTEFIGRSRRVEEIPNGLHVSLSYKQQKTGTASENVSENVSEKLSLNQQKIMSAIKSDKKITYTELSKLVGIAPTNVARNIKKLIESKKLIRIGPAKGGHWEVAD